MSAVVYTAREARARFAELLRRVRNGETVAVSYRGAPVAEIRPQAEAPAHPPVGDGAASAISLVKDGAGASAISLVEDGAGQAVSPVEQGAPEQGGVDLSVFDFPPAVKDEAELEARLADMRRRGVLAPSSQPRGRSNPFAWSQAPWSASSPNATERANPAVPPTPSFPRKRESRLFGRRASAVIPSPITGEDAANGRRSTMQSP